MHSSILACPVCRDPLSQIAKSYRCARNHTFDIARQGYVNLLPVQKKGSREPGDSIEMVQGRRRFLAAGHYDIVSDAINRVIAGLLSNATELRILDAGCGIGFYLNRLIKYLPSACGIKSIDCYGLDISKAAVRIAATTDRSVHWLVASVNELPLRNSSTDLILNVFSPTNFGEFARILGCDGRLVIVRPGPSHLNGLRKRIYPEVHDHAPADLAGQASPFFLHTATERIFYPLELTSNESIMDLLTMTPYYWNIDRATHARLASINRLTLEVDMQVHTFTNRK